MRNPGTGGSREFTKHIRLDGTRIDVEYAGVPANHLVANEFSLDFLSMLMRGRRQSIRRAAPDQARVERSDLDLGATVSTACNLNVFVCHEHRSREPAVASRLFGLR
jgi:hypothetical protein